MKTRLGLDFLNRADVIRPTGADRRGVGRMNGDHPACRGDLIRSQGCSCGRHHDHFPNGSRQFHSIRNRGRSKVARATSDQNLTPSRCQPTTITLKCGPKSLVVPGSLRNHVAHKKRLIVIGNRCGAVPGRAHMSAVISSIKRRASNL